MTVLQGGRRSPATMPGYHAGRTSPSKACATRPPRPRWSQGSGSAARRLRSALARERLAAVDPDDHGS